MAKRYCAGRNLPVKNEPLSPGMPATQKEGKGGGVVFGTVVLNPWFG